jgi:2-polyprenyl-3-methyl-5-hydroxy-6-metoxy-1,4-benzoquinol methylase
MSIPVEKEMDWRSLTENPVDSQVYAMVRKQLVTKTEAVHGGFIKLLELFTGKTVLDIGVAEHDLTHYANKETWKHGMIKSVAATCLGVDILQPMVERLNADGYECLCVDATSDIDIGKRFNYVHIGDVIEHVSDPIKLIRFAARHLAENGEIVVTTPNPYFYQNIVRVIREGMLVANFEHVTWIGESMAQEIAHRADVELRKIYRPVSRRWLVAAVQKANLGIFSDKYYYFFAKKTTAS